MKENLLSESLLSRCVGQIQRITRTIRGIRHVFYAKSTVAWRIDAYIMMMAAAAKAGWSEGFERLEGSLLGYEEWQTDLHLERLRTSPHAGKFSWLRKT
jgi:hypothetical protein